MHFHHHLLLPLLLFCLGHYQLAIFTLISKSSCSCWLFITKRTQSEGSWLTIAHSNMVNTAPLVVLVLVLTSPSLHFDQHLFSEACSETHPRAEKEKRA